MSSPSRIELHDARRRTVFRAVADVLREEELEWARARLERPRSVEKFEWAFGVRSAAELAIGYLAIKRLLVRDLVGEAFLWPEFPLDNLGRVDLWIGEGDGRRGAGVGIELKPLMGPGAVESLVAQSRRLCRHERLDAAALIAWGHDRDALEADLPTLNLNDKTPPGWTPWRLLDSERFVARFKSEDARCYVGLWGAERA